ncbi:histidine phosphatase family protein [uncultured Litoreibacter sp.]|uniref:SixA phosphatase family protein n=1 Tax=uncultured Litoreibacter sp. TaxID=1392394 RepID=UPI00260BEC61|nr:histidine phosphatase family protein [uncultured Litoreibacter sp.]
MLVRHAKSSWDDLTLDDHDRPLNERGEAGAERMGAWLADRGHVPKTLLCSTAKRAEMTAKILMEQFADKPVTDYISGLYHATPDTILAKIRNAPAGDLMVVGHNPGMASFADLISETRPKHERFASFPTTSTLISEVHLDSWKDLKFGDARLINFVVPRDLKVLL